MRTRYFASLDDRDLLAALATRVAQERESTAEVVTLIGEVESRRLFAHEGYPSMHAYCVEALHLSDDAAYKRIHVARKAREFPEILDALADGRLHMTAVLMIGPELTPANATELLRAAEHKTKAKIELLLAARRPQTEVMPMVLAVPASTPSCSSTRSSAGIFAPVNVQRESRELAPERVVLTANVAPIAQDRFIVQLSIGRELRDKLEYAEELASHQIAPGDLAGLLEQMADAFIAKQEKRKFAATDKPRQPQGENAQRTIPAHVRRAVWKRDGGRCTYCSDNDHRCESRRRLEFDHAVPVARGGESTVENLRLRCRVHNQYVAERMFGSEFMEKKRAETVLARTRAAGS